MSSLSAHQFQDAVIINHVHLRAPSQLQAECQQQLLSLNDIAQVTGTKPGQYVFFRHVRVNQTSSKLSAAVVSTLHELSEDIIDGNSPQAHYAQAVRFNSLGDLLALLSLNIQDAQACPWFFESWHKLFYLSKIEALCRLWTEHKTDLADMIDVLARQKKLTNFFRSLSSQQSGALFNALTHSFSIQHTAEPTTLIEHMKPTAYPCLLNESAFAVWSGIFKKTNVTDSHLHLAVFFLLLKWRADLLQKQDAMQIIKHVADFVVNSTKDSAVSDKTFSKKSMSWKNHSKIIIDDEYKQGQHSPAETDKLPTNDVRIRNVRNKKNRPAIHLDHPSFDSTQKESNTVYHTKQEIIKSKKQQLLNRLSVQTKNTALQKPAKDNRDPNQNPDQVSAIAVVDKMQSLSSDSSETATVFSYQGGLFYLLNFMARKPVQDLLEKNNVFDSNFGAWGALYRLADLLHREDEITLDRFFTYRMGLDNTAQLKLIPRLASANEYQQLAEKFYGAHVWNASLLQMPAQIEYSASHLDIHYPLHQLKFNVRRVGLDIDPGWLAWFGQVVRFHYHADFLQGEATDDS